MYRGHSDNSPGSILAVTDVADSYNGTGNTSAQAMGSGKEQRRTFTLSNGEVIWDMAGNAWEWTDWILGGGLTSGPTSCGGGWTQLPGVSCAALAAADYMPANPASVTGILYNSNYGLGQFNGGGGGTAQRGGSLDSGTQAGPFALDLRFGLGESAAHWGFRCVYRPTSVSVPSISFAGSSGTTGSVGAAMSVTPSTLNNGGASITNCTSSPTLPSGLLINAPTCVISGTPTVSVSATAYTISATNSAGVATASVTLSVAAVIPALSFAGSSGTTGTVGVAMSVAPSSLNNGGSAITNCTSSPTLPSGLSINASTCVISGTPTVSVSATTYTISATNSSGLGTAPVTLTVSVPALVCPTRYIPVPANGSLGISSFCVMKYEAKNVAGVATSQAASTPWANISAPNAKTKCTDLGANYDLISNPEWMTIAYDAERTGSNWSGGNPGSGAMYRGHSDNSPGSGLAVTDAADSYNGTGNTSSQAMGSGKQERRIFTLSNGEVIWDFSGNLFEWTDWILGGGFDSAPIISTSCTNSGGWTEIPFINCGPLAAADYIPGNPAGISMSSYNSTFGLGRFLVAYGGGSLRGGFFNDSSNNGVFSLQLNVSPNTSDTVIGFRCVYRP